MSQYGGEGEGLVGLASTLKGAVPALPLLPLLKDQFLFTHLHPLPASALKGPVPVCPTLLLKGVVPAHPWSLLKGHFLPH